MPQQILCSRYAQNVFICIYLAPHLVDDFGPRFFGFLSLSWYGDDDGDDVRPRLLLVRELLPVRHSPPRRRWKDAQRDAERTGYFCVNVVSDGLAWAMNASAAPLGRGLSEFHLAGGGGSPNRADDNGSVHDNERIAPSPLPAPAVDAPFVSQSPSFMECRYVKTGKP